MAASPWKALLNVVPADGATVWVRQWYAGPPVLATWDLATQSFTLSSDARVIPWWQLGEWKPQ